MSVVELVEKKQALGGEVEIGVVSQWSSSDRADIFSLVWHEILEFEKRFSRFLPSSELSYINKRAGLTTSISEQMEAILEKAKELADVTERIYNPFILPALQRAGYVRSALEGYENDEAPDYTKRHIATVDQLSLSDHSVNIPHGSALDLGGCGKGYLADRIGSILRKKHALGYWLSFSGDIATFGTDVDGRPITLAIQSAEPEPKATYVVTCPVTSFGVATSGTFRRANQVHTLQKHHIIDPRTGKPSESDMLLATVCAKSAVEADVLASCAVVLGSSAAVQFLKDRNVLGWVLQYRDNKNVNIKVAGDCIGTEGTYA